MRKRRKPKFKIVVNDKRYFRPDDIAIGALRAYAVYVPTREARA